VASRPSARDAVSCRGVAKVWAAGTERAHEALRDIDLDVAPGEFTVLIGPSGCGKSTLLYLIAGLEPETDGEIWSFGDRVATPSPDRSLIFQETSLFPWLTVWQNVSFGLSIRGTPAAERKAVAREALHRVGLTEAMDKRVVIVTPIRPPSVVGKLETAIRPVPTAGRRGARGPHNGGPVASRTATPSPGYRHRKRVDELLSRARGQGAGAADSG